MKSFVFHVFSGTKESLERKTGGVETFLNNMLKHNTQEFYSIVIGRQHYIIPDIMTAVRSSKSGSDVNQRYPFPYFMYLMSNLVLGWIISFKLFFWFWRHERAANLIIHVHDPVIAASLFLFYPKFINNATFVSQFHSQYSDRLKIMLTNTLLTKITLKLHSFSEKLCISRSDMLIVVSENIRRYLLNFGCSPNKIEKIPIFLEIPSNNLEFEDATTNIRLPSSEKQRFILTYIGRLSREKNLDVLLSAFLLLDPTIRKNFMLLIVGQGNQFDHIKSLSASVSDRVLLLGHRTDIDSILKISDVFILPSLAEGFPFSLLEAMSYGKAIIASNIPPIVEIVSDRREAILFDPNSPEQLSAAIMRLYTNPELRRIFELNVKAKAKQYDVNVILPKLLNMYKRIQNDKAIDHVSKT